MAYLFNNFACQDIQQLIIRQLLIHIEGYYDRLSTKGNQSVQLFISQGSKRSNDKRYIDRQRTTVSAS